MQFQGTMKLSRLAKSLASDVNVKRRAKGLLPRPVLFFPFLLLPEAIYENRIINVVSPTSVSELLKFFSVLNISSCVLMVVTIILQSLEQVLNHCW